MVLLDSESLINAKSINGFWWKGNLEKFELNSRLLGDIEIQFLPFSLLKGKASFNTVIKGSEIDIVFKDSLSIGLVTLIKTYDYEIYNVKIHVDLNYRNG